VTLIPIEEMSMLDNKPRNDEVPADALQEFRPSAGGMDVEGTDEIRTQFMSRASDKVSETGGRGR